MEIEVFNIFQISFPQYFLAAGLHISLSDILDKNMGLGEQVYIIWSYLRIIIQFKLHPTTI